MTMKDVPDVATDTRKSRANQRFRQDRAENAVARLIDRAGGDPNSDSMRDTPARFVKALEYWTSGYRMNGFEVLKTFDHAHDCDSLVFQANIPTYSLCEHHLAPFFGVTHIGYIPNGKVVGLSKLARLVDVYARRFQIQERLASNVADDLFEHLEAKGVGVVMQMRHLCMESRGVQKSGTVTVTSTLRGVMKDDPTCRSEFMTLVATATGGLRQI